MWQLHRQLSRLQTVMLCIHKRVAGLKIIKESGVFSRVGRIQYLYTLQNAPDTHVVFRRKDSNVPI